MLGSLWFNSFSAGGGAAADYELISTTVLASSAASVTFSGLGTSAAAYKHLQLRITGKAVTAGGTAFIQFNGDAASNYAYHFLYGSGSSVASGNLVGTNAGCLVFGIAGLDNVYSFASITDILDFSSTNKNKTTRTLSGRVQPTSYEVELASGVWLSTATVTSLSINTPNSFATGSRFSLYGLR